MPVRTARGAAALLGPTWMLVLVLSRRKNSVGWGHQRPNRRRREVDVLLVGSDEYLEDLDLRTSLLLVADLDE